MGGQLDGNFLHGSLPHKFIILIVTSFICLRSIIFFSLSGNETQITPGQLQRKPDSQTSNLQVTTYPNCANIHANRRRAATYANTAEQITWTTVLFKLYQLFVLVWTGNVKLCTLFALKVSVSALPWYITLVILSLQFCFWLYCRTCSTVKTISKWSFTYEREYVHPDSSYHAAPSLYSSLFARR